MGMYFYYAWHPGDTFTVYMDKKYIPQGSIYHYKDIMQAPECANGEWLLITKDGDFYCGKPPESETPELTVSTTE